jgi:hypothetical protein
MRYWLKRAVLTRILCALALVMLGFGSHAVADPFADPYGVEYRLPDGSYTSLCEPGDDKGGAPHDASHHCDICVLAVGHLFVPPDAIFAGRPMRARGEAIRAAEYMHLHRLLSSHSLSRGPPLFA